MNELKPCPFYGSTARGCTPKSKSVWCENKDCENHSASFSRKDWNTRPIEDALRAENEQLKADNARMREALETALGKIKSVFDGVPDTASYDDFDNAADEILIICEQALKGGE